MVVHPQQNNLDLLPLASEIFSAAIDIAGEIAYATQGFEDNDGSVNPFSTHNSSSTPSSSSRSFYPSTTSRSTIQRQPQHALRGAQQGHLLGRENLNDGGGSGTSSGALGLPISQYMPLFHLLLSRTALL